MLDEEALITGCRVGEAFDSLVFNILKATLQVVIYSVLKYEPWTVSRLREVSERARLGL